MATSEEFNKMFDMAEAEYNKLQKACAIAYSCGFNLNYMDGSRVDVDYKEDCFKEIEKLLGKSEKDWPKSIIESYKEGCNEGYLET